MKKIIGVWAKRFYYQFANQITKKKSERTSGLDILTTSNILKL
jgi:hypothetical protein